MSSYSDDVNATVFSPFGTDVPNSGGFAPGQMSQYGIEPPAVAARRRKEKKRDAQRKLGAQVMDQNTVVTPTTTASTPAPPPPSGAPPKPAGAPSASSRPGTPQVPRPGSNAMPSASLLPKQPTPAIPNVFQPSPPPSNDGASPYPEFHAAEYHEPAKGLDYLALGLNLLFPGAPIAGLAAGLMGGLQQRSQNRYARDEQNAQMQYESQVASYQSDRESAYLKTIGPAPVRTKGMSDAAYESQLKGYYDRATAGALNAQLPGLAAQLSTIQTHAASSGEHVAQGAEADARIPLDQARTSYYNQYFPFKREELQATIQAKLQIARGAERARIIAAGDQAAASIQRANISAGGAMQRAELTTEARLIAEYAAIKGNTAIAASRNATQLVIAAENNAERGAVSQARATGDWSGVQGGGQPAAANGGPGMIFSPTVVVGSPPQPTMSVLRLSDGTYFDPATGRHFKSADDVPKPKHSDTQTTSTAPRRGPVPAGGFDPLNPASAWQDVPTTHTNPGPQPLPPGIGPVPKGKAITSPTGQKFVSNGDGTMTPQ